MRLNYPNRKTMYRIFLKDDLFANFTKWKNGRKAYHQPSLIPGYLGQKRKNWSNQQDKEPTFVLVTTTRLSAGARGCRNRIKIAVTREEPIV